MLILCPHCGKPKPFVQAECQHCLDLGPKEDPKISRKDAVALNKLKSIIRHYGLTYKEIASITGYSLRTIKDIFTPKARQFPRWGYLVIWLHEKGDF